MYALLPGLSLPDSELRCREGSCESCERSALASVSRKSWIVNQVSKWLGWWRRVNRASLRCEEEEELALDFEDFFAEVL